MKICKYLSCITILIILIFISNTIYSNALYPQPRIDLDEYTINVTDKTSVYVEGTVSKAYGQQISVRDTSFIPVAIGSVGNSGGKESFRIKIHSSYINTGSNTFYVYSEPVRGKLARSNSKTFIVKYADGKQSQTITASNKSVAIGKSIQLNAKASSGLPLSYKSNDSSIATVDRSGKVIGRKVGFTKIVISQDGNSQYSSVTKTIIITVTKAEYTKPTIKPAIKKVSIFFKSNSGKGTMKYMRVNANKAVKLNKNKYKLKGHTFKGWSTKKNGAVKYKNRQSIKINKNIVLYAKWEAKDPKTTSGGYLKKGSKKWDLKPGSGGISGYRNVQCVTTDGDYLYTVRMLGSSSYGRIAKYNLSSQKLVKYSSKLYLGHGNDIAYNEKDECLYITRNQSNDTSLTKVKASNLKKVGTVKVRGTGANAFNGVAYDKGYLYVRARKGGSKIYKINSKYKKVKTYACSMNGRSSAPYHHGMEVKNGKVYGLQSGKSVTTNCFLVTGKLKKRTEGSYNRLGVSAELEGIFKWNGHLYVGLNKKYAYYIKQIN